MANDKVAYIWTKADDDILNGTCPRKPQCSPGKHTCYVTPWGIPISKAIRDLAPKPNIGCIIDLSLSKHGEVGRAARFHVDLPWWPKPQTEEAKSFNKKPIADCEWVEAPPSLPASVDTLTKLGEYLMKLDSAAYPKSIYGVTHLTGHDHPAQLLFDYWGNTAYRAAIMSEGGDSSYSTAPGDIALASNSGTRIKYVVRKISALSAVKLAPALEPGDKKCLKVPPPDPVDVDLDNYIHTLRTATQNIRTMRRISNEAITKRLEPIRKLHALEKLLLLCEKMTNKPTSAQAQALLGQLSIVIADDAASKVLIELPVRNQTDLEAAIKEWEKRNATGNQSLTANASRDAEKYARTIKALLIEGDGYRDVVKKWAQKSAVVLGTTAGASNVSLREKAEELAAVMAEANLELCNTLPGEMKNHDYLGSLQRTPEGYATTEVAVDQKTALDVALSLVGKGAKLSSKSASLAIHVLQSHAIFKMVRISEGMASTLAKGLSGAETAKEAKEAMNAFAAEVHKELPKMLDGVQLNAAVEKALLQGDRVQLLELRKAIAAQKTPYAKSIQWTGVLQVLSLISTAVAMRDAPSLPAGKQLTIDDFFSAIDTAGTLVGTTIGTVEWVVSSFTRLEAVATALKTAGNAVGFVGGCVSVMMGCSSFLKAAQEGDRLGAFTAYLDVSGGVVGLIAVGTALLEVAAFPPVGAIALAFAVASGAIKIGVTLTASDVTELCKAIVADVRSTKDGVVWGYAVEGQPKLGNAMIELERLLKDSHLPTLVDEEWVRKELRAAGLEPYFKQLLDPQKAPPERMKEFL